MSNGFVFDDRAAREAKFTDNQQLVNSEFTRQHSVSKIEDDRNLTELDKLRQRAGRGELW